MNIEKLKAEQISLAERIEIRNRISFDEIEFVAGVDQAFGDFRGKETFVISAAVLMSFPELHVVESKSVTQEVDFPYIPGFLMFREGKSAIRVLKELIVNKRKVVVLVDGSGIAHPRKCGLASYIAIKTGLPTIGITKHRLVGDYEEPEKAGEAKPLFFEGEKIGYVLKPCKRCNPIFISPGSYLTPELSLKIVKACMKGFKLPEPIRLADKLAKERKRNLRTEKIEGSR